MEERKMKQSVKCICLFFIVSCSGFEYIDPCEGRYHERFCQLQDCQEYPIGEIYNRPEFEVFREKRVMVNHPGDVYWYDPEFHCLNPNPPCCPPDWFECISPMERCEYLLFEDDGEN